MTSQFAWMSDDSEAPVSIDPYSQWLFRHGRAFALWNREPKDPDSTDFEYFAVLSDFGDPSPESGPPSESPPADGIAHLLSVNSVFAPEAGIGGGGTYLNLYPAGSEAGRLMLGQLGLGAGANSGPRLPAPEESVLAVPVPLRDRQVGPRRLDPPEYVAPDGLDPARAVIMAVIDDTFNLVHDRFVGDGRRSRIDFAWVQDGDHHSRSTVNFGREYERAEIESALRQMPYDEDQALDDLGLLDFSTYGRRGLAWQGSHGTHVMDLAAGSDPTSASAINQRIIAVQLPELATRDTSGATLDVFVLAGLHFILDRARIISKSLKTPVPVVVNFSYAVAGGPHDGSHFIERTFHALIRQHQRLGGGLVEVVLPAGNRYLARGHAISQRSASTLSLPWRIQPADMTPNYLEIWLPDGARDIEVTVTRPDGSAPQRLIPTTTGTILARDAGGGGPDPDTVIARLSLDRNRADSRPKGTADGHNATAKAKRKQRVLLVVAPTDPAWERRTTAPAGVWHVTVTAKSLDDGHIEAWIQRDDAPFGYRRDGRPSYFDDPAYVRFDPMGDVEQRDVGDSVVHRFGSLSGIATRRGTVVVGGYQLRDHKAALYSAAAEPGMAAPDGLAVTDRSRVLGGVLGAGNRSGSALALNGTSVAAPQVARWLADHLAEPGHRPNFSGESFIRGLATGNEAGHGGKWPAIPPERMGAGRTPVPPGLRRRVEG